MVSYIYRVMKAVFPMKQRFTKTRNETLKICENLSTEDYVVQPTAEVSPPKWHLGHTTWFFEEFILSKYVPGFKKFNEEYFVLFNSYYKSMGKHWIQGNRGQLSRPSVQEIMNYRAYIDKEMVKLLDKKSNDKELNYLLEVGINHEEQHQELLYMDIKYILGVNPLFPKLLKEKPKKCSKPEEKWSTFKEGLYDIGYTGDEFHYDNESPNHKKYVYSFTISESLVTNAEYLEFMIDGGYENSSLWLSEGFDWVNNNKICAPLYWNKQGSHWFEFTFLGNNQLDLYAPVSHLSYFEAYAYALWKKMRLPTEEEYEIFQNLNKDESPLWCWTNSSYGPYPKFKPFEGKLGEYNGKFMCNQYVLRGGCSYTPSGHFRNTYRNFYKPHQRWMFSGMRLAKDL